MQELAAGALDITFADKRNFDIIIVMIVMQPVSLCRRTPFMISSLHVHVIWVMMLIMIMITRKGCGSLRNLYASAVGHLS